MDDTDRVVCRFVRDALEDHVPNLNVADHKSEDGRDRRLRKDAVTDRPDEVETAQLGAGRRTDHRVVPDDGLLSWLPPILAVQMGD